METIALFKIIVFLGSLSHLFAEDFKNDSSTLSMVASNFSIFEPIIMPVVAKSHNPSSYPSFSYNIEMAPIFPNLCNPWCKKSSILWKTKCQFSSCMDCNTCKAQLSSMSPSSKTESPTTELSENPSTESGLLHIGPVFLFNKDLKYFLEHRRIARKLGYELASIRTEEEDMLLENFFSNIHFDSKRPIYVGGIRKKNGAFFQWIDGTDFGGYQNWISDEEPNHVTQEACLSLNYEVDWGWDDTGCERLLMGLYRRRENIISMSTVAPSTSFFISPVTLSNNCKSHCHSSQTVPWEQKCTWFDCEGCESCNRDNTPSPSVFESSSCSYFCDDLTSLPWEQKCKWSDCKACQSCAHTYAPSTLSPSVLNCRSHCYSSPTNSWVKKCGWFDCEGCLECKTAAPSFRNCQAWCANISQVSWTEKCKWSPCHNCLGCKTTPSAIPSTTVSMDLKGISSFPSFLSSVAPSVSNSPSITPSSVNCSSHCFTSTFLTWSEICELDDCNSCNDCELSNSTIGKCQPFCKSMHASWIEKCYWSPCRTCIECTSRGSTMPFFYGSLRPSLLLTDSNIPSLTPTSQDCKPHCSLKNSSMLQMCSLSECQGCYNCITTTPTNILETASTRPSLNTLTPTKSPIPSCKLYCHTSVTSWAQKCRWNNCRSCENCVTPPPSIVNCQPWCESNPHPWTHPDKSVKQKCNYDLTCAGCPQCRKA